MWLWEAGTRAQVSSAGGCIGKDAPWEDQLVSRGKGVFLLSLEGSRVLSYPRAALLPWQQHEQKETLREVSLLLQVKGSRGFQIQHGYHLHMLQLHVLHQPTVVAGTAQVSPLQHGPSCLTGDGSMKQI